MDKTPTCRHGNNNGSSQRTARTGTTATATASSTSRMHSQCGNRGVRLSTRNDQARLDVVPVRIRQTAVAEHTGVCRTKSYKARRDEPSSRNALTRKYKRHPAQPRSVATAVIAPCEDKPMIFEVHQVPRGVARGQIGKIDVGDREFRTHASHVLPSHPSGHMRYAHYKKRYRWVSLISGNPPPAHNILCFHYQHMIPTHTLAGVGYSPSSSPPWQA